MRLLYPISTELLTLDFVTHKALERELRQQQGMSILQYRAMSWMQQNRLIEESRLVEELNANASQLSQDLGKLTEREFVSWERSTGSARSWALTRLGKAALDDADITLTQVYERFFSELDDALEENVRSGLRLTSQSQGIIRVRGEGYFDEHSFFESVLSIVQTVTKSLHPFGLSPVQFRILFELRVRGPVARAQLAKALILTRSTVSWGCETLAERGLVRVATGSSAKSLPVTLTSEGRVEAERAAECVDRAWCEMRVWSPDERLYYQQAAEYFARSFAR